MFALLLAANLGVSHFAATGPKACQKRVLEGVLNLHSFVYEDAREAFIDAEKAAPCPIAYWGEAMTYDHPIWGESDAEKAKAALAKIPPGARVSPAEKGLIEAAHALFEKDRAAWMERLRRLHDELPKDDEVALFYALSLIANSREGADVKRSMQAAAIAIDVFERNPNHPGAAHYLIHACDTPDHAILALEAARRYAQIAPSSAHALHMPSHIFVQLGMWPQVEASNLAAVKASTDWAAAHDLPRARADWHSYAWLAEARVELGRADEVLPMIARVRELREKEDPGNWTLRHVHASLVSAWLTGTQKWARTEELLSTTDSRLEVRILLDAAAALVDDPKAAQLGEQLAKLDSSPMGKLFVAARLAQAHSVRDTGSIGDAIAATRAWADAEDREPASGPAFSMPAREELGDLFLRSHRFAEAEEAFRAALERRPNRLHALKGLEESARSAGDLRAAAEAQSKLPSR
jgi:tetratricopeptide (TPR) repeat protein